MCKARFIGAQKTTIYGVQYIPGDNSTHEIDCAVIDALPTLFERVGKKKKASSTKNKKVKKYKNKNSKDCNDCG